MATSFTIPTPRTKPTTNLTLSSPFAQPGTTQAAPVPDDAIQRLRALTAMAPENEGIVGVMQGGVPLLTNRPEAVRGLSDDDAFGAFDQMTAYGSPQDVLGDYIRGSRNTARTSRLNQSADEAFDAQQAQQRVTAGARDFERGQRSADIVSDTVARGRGETSAFHRPEARDMRRELGGVELSLAEAKTAGDRARAQADMYTADRSARAREAAIPGQQIGAYADVLASTADMGQHGPAVRDLATRGIMQASGQQTATEADVLDYATRMGVDPEVVRRQAQARGFVIVPE